MIKKIVFLLKKKKEKKFVIISFFIDNLAFNAMTLILGIRYEYC
jgi:hypothetical protein